MVNENSISVGSPPTRKWTGPGCAASHTIDIVLFYIDQFL